MRIARNAFKNAGGFKLSDLAAHFGIEIQTMHRALSDCQYTLNVYNAMYEYLTTNNINLEIQ